MNIAAFGNGVHDFGPPSSTREMGLMFLWCRVFENVVAVVI
jgi:hypothetical protein